MLSCRPEADSTHQEAAGLRKSSQVIGWNLYSGRSVVTVSHVETPDFAWFNSRPELLKEHRGSGVEALIDRIEAAVIAYPYPYQYRVWPGPNSNSFIAYVAREVPELGLDLPPTAIGYSILSPDNCQLGTCR